MKNTGGLLSFMVASGVIAMVGLTGCEKEEAAFVITITPNPVEVTVSNDTVMLTATSGTRALSLPMTWTVSNPALGYINPAERGYNVVYVSGDSNGVNFVTVTDQYGAEGHATISHNYTSSTGTVDQVGVGLIATLGEIPVGENSTTITATNGVAPYSWRVGDATQGNVEPSGNPVVYTSSRPGNNTIYVTDRDGRQGQITIVQN